jgi:hypothetical protein
VIAHVDAVLRAEGAWAVGRGRVPWAGLAAIVGAGGLAYGAAMGSFGLRAEQSLYSAVKVPLLLAVSTLVCLPSFYAMNAVLGLREDFAAACRGVFASQATVAAGLASLLPVTLTGYASSSDYRFAVVLNGACFLAAALAGQRTLGRHYAPLVRANPRHHVARAAWLALYVFVAIQLAWLLRPFVGDPALEPRFLREEAWSNAYVVVARTVWELVSRALGGG